MILSIIVPAYNSAEWLRDCVDSLMDQDLQDYEVIVIDDGSTDTTWSTMQALESVYGAKLRIVSKPNEGVSATRNRGMDLALGRWIMFVDSDDTIQRRSLGRIFHQVEANEGCDWVFLGVSVLKGKSESHCDYSELKDCYSPTLLAAKTLDSTFSNPWAKLYNHEILTKNNIRFDSDIKMYEDALFNMRYLRSIQSAVVLPEPFYRYVARPGSSSRRYHGEHIIEVAERLRRERIEYFVNNYGMTKMIDKINRDVAFVYLFAIYSIYRADAVKDKYSKLKRYWGAATEEDAQWSFQLDNGLPRVFATIARQSLYVSHLFLLTIFSIEKIKRIIN